MSNIRSEERRTLSNDTKYRLVSLLIYTNILQRNVFISEHKLKPTNADMRFTKNVSTPLHCTYECIIASPQ